MTTDTAILDNDADTPIAWAQGVLRRHVGLLEQLAEAGLRMALAIEAGVTQPEPAQPLSSDALAARSMAFSRVARAVRMTGLLQARLVKDMEEARNRAAFDQRCEAIRADAEADAEAEAAEDAAREDPAYAHKARVEAIVSRVARDHFKDGGQDPDRIERLVRETGERLDDDDIYGDVLTRPVGELVALICRDLGLDPDWGRLGQEAWAQAEMASGHPSSPFSGHGVRRPPSFAAANGGGGKVLANDVASRRTPAEEPIVAGAGHVPHVPNSSPETHLNLSG